MVQSGNGNGNGRRQGFTIVELLVVIVIIALIMGILLPTVFRAYGSADKVAIAADLQTISTALDQYKSDFGDYPRPAAASGGTRGARLLVTALVAPGSKAADGMDGPGFKVGLGTKIYGPYLDLTHFKLNTTATPLGDPVQSVLLDKSGNPIVYLPASPLAGKINRTTGEQYILPKDRFFGADTSYLFNSNDFPELTASGSATQSKKFYAMLGDANRDGDFDTDEQPQFTGPYLLWSAGTDGVYGPEKLDSSSDVTKCDDVLNLSK